MLMFSIHNACLKSLWQVTSIILTWSYSFILTSLLIQTSFFMRKGENQCIENNKMLIGIRLFNAVTLWFGFIILNTTSYGDRFRNNRIFILICCSSSLTKALLYRNLLTCCKEIRCSFFYDKVYNIHYKSGVKFFFVNYKFCALFRS